MSTESGGLPETEYSYRTCLEKGIGINPDELIAAVLNGCFSMALSKEMGLVGLSSERIDTTATATLEELAADWTMTRIQLDIHAQVLRHEADRIYRCHSRSQGQISDRAPAQPQYFDDRKSNSVAEIFGSGGAGRMLPA